MKRFRRMAGALILCGGLALVVALAVARARRPAWEDLSCPMAQLGGCVYLYANENNGKTPPSVEALAAAGLSSPDLPGVLRGEVHYLAPGRDLKTLPENTVLAVQDPQRYGHYVYLSVLLADSSVVGVKPGAFRGVPLRPDVPLRAEGRWSDEMRVVAEEPQQPGTP